MLWNAGLAAYHSGVEWHWWEGPKDCSGTGRRNFGPAGGLADLIQNTRVIRCDEAAWRFLGLSLAGYNVLISLALAVIAVGRARRVARGRARRSSVAILSPAKRDHTELSRSRFAGTTE